MVGPKNNVHNIFILHHISMAQALGIFKARYTVVKISSVGFSKEH